MADRFPGEQPRFDQPVVDQSGRVTQAWANYFLRLASVQSSDDLRALYEALAARVAALEEGEAASFQILGQQSVSVNGVPQPGHVVIITLQGDADSPGNTTYYGTGPTGAKGWFPVSGAITVSSGELTKSVGADGVTTFGLANVADSGAGSLLAITRDGKGRVTGTRPATITGTAGRVAVTNGDASAGLPTIDLATVADSGAGVLLAITKDAYGRVTGTRQATITGTAQQINVANGTAAAGLPTLSLASEVISSLGKADSALQPGAAHNTALSGLQGGSSTERYHSTAIQNSSLAAVAVSGEICGLQMVWNSGTSITFTSGFAAIQSLGGLLSFPSPITKAGLSLSASTWYHAYGYSNAGTPDVEIVTTVPASTAFSGSARSKTGDTSRRYLGSLLTDASGNIYRFGQNGDEINYVVNLVAPFRVLSGGMATTRTNVALSGVIPVTSNYVIANTINNADQQVFIDIPEIGNSGAASRYTCLANQRTPIHAFVASRTLQYLYGVSPVGSGAFIDVWGYRFER